MESWFEGLKHRHPYIEHVYGHNRYTPSYVVEKPRFGRMALVYILATVEFFVLFGVWFWLMRMGIHGLGIK